MLQVAGPLQIALRTGLFRADSLLYKSLRRTLTDEQAARCDAWRFFLAKSRPIKENCVNPPPPASNREVECYIVGTR